MKEIDDLPGTADYLGITEKSLRQRRYRGEGPPAIKVGSLVRFRRVDVDRWLDEHAEVPQGAR